jgi:hypothetical protein
LLPTTRGARSDDKGLTFSPAADISHASAAADGWSLQGRDATAPDALLLWAGRVGLVSDVFLERAATPTPTVPLVNLSAHNPLGPDAVAAEVASPSWTQTAPRLPSAHTGILFSQSHDDGKTFSAPMRVAESTPHTSLPCIRH